MRAARLASAGLGSVRVAWLTAPAALGLAACNPCNQVCADVSQSLDQCMTPAFTWADLGARNRDDWRTQCERDWDRTAGRLNTRDLEVALDVCSTTLDELPSLDCDQIRALYAPL